MKSFLDAQVGDTLTRKHDNESYDAEVQEITPTEIVCRVVVDMPRIMKFHKTTGVNVLGEEYGHLL